MSWQCPVTLNPCLGNCPANATLDGPACGAKEQLNAVGLRGQHVSLPGPSRVIVPFTTTPTLEAALGVLDNVRKDLQAGVITAFIVAALDDKDVTYGYHAASKPVTRGRLLGCLEQAAHDFKDGEF